MQLTREYCQRCSAEAHHSQSCDHDKTNAVPDSLVGVSLLWVDFHVCFCISSSSVPDQGLSDVIGGCRAKIGSGDYMVGPVAVCVWGLQRQVAEWRDRDN